MQFLLRVVGGSFFYPFAMYSCHQSVFLSLPGGTCPISTCSVLTSAEFTSTLLLSVIWFVWSGCAEFCRVCPFTDFPVMAFSSYHSSSYISLLVYGQVQNVVWASYILFIHLSADGPLDCFCFLAIMNTAAVNTLVQVAVWMYVNSDPGYTATNIPSGNAGPYRYSGFYLLRN